MKTLSGHERRFPDRSSPSQIFPPPKRLLLLCVLFASTGHAVLAQTAVSRSERCRTTIVPLDGTGIASWRYLNPRSPWPLLQDCLKGTAGETDQTCLNEESIENNLGCSDILFTNQTPDRSFLVKLHLEQPKRHPELIKILRGLTASGSVSTANQRKDDDRTRDYRKKILNILDNTSHDDEDYRELIELLGAIHGVGGISEEFLEKMRSQGLHEELTCILHTTATCKDRHGTDDSQICTQSGIVSSASPLRIPGEVLRCANPFSLVTTTVEFFDDAAKPANTTGFLYAGSKIEKPGKTYPEPPRLSRWKIVGSIGAAWDPAGRFDDAGNTRTFRPAEGETYQGDQRQHFPAAARVQLSQNLGSRASANVTFAFKSGDQGETDQDRTAKVPNYQINMYAENGLAFTFGKYDFASPTSGVAIAESGEGFEVRVRQFSLSHLVKRESLDGRSDAENQDSDVTLLKIDNWNIPWLQSGRGSFIALHGRDENPQQAHTFSTAGFEYSLTRSVSEAGGGSGKKTPLRAVLGFTAGYYRSERDRDVPDHLLEGADASKQRNGKGDAALFSFSFARLEDTPSFNAPRVKWTLNARFAQGSGDDPGTPDVDEGYIGETQSFKPDGLFISSLAQLLDAGEQGQVGRGLINKRYRGLSWTGSWDPILHRFASWLNPIDEPRGQTTLRLHHYRFQEHVLGENDAGWGADLIFEVEGPKGSKASLTFAYFDPGSALDAFFKEKPWAIQLSLTGTLD